MTYVAIARRAALVACIAGLVVLPVRACVGPVNGFEVLSGVVLAEVFFGMTALVVALAERTGELDMIKAVLWTYVAKVSLLASAALLVPVPGGFDRSAFAAGVVSTAVVYVVAETTLLARRLR